MSKISRTYSSDLTVVPNTTTRKLIGIRPKVFYITNLGYIELYIISKYKDIFIPKKDFTNFSFEIIYYIIYIYTNNRRIK